MIIVTTITQVIKVKNRTLEQVMELLIDCGITEQELVSIVEIE